MRINVIFSILFVIGLLACYTQENSDKKPNVFFERFNSDVFLNQTSGYQFHIDIADFRPAETCCYIIKCSISDNSGYVPFSYYGYIYYKDSTIYTTPLFLNDTFPIFNLQKVQGFHEKLPVKGFDSFEIIKLGMVSPNYRNYDNSIFAFRFPNIVPAYEGINGDMVIFLSRACGPIGSYFSVIINDHLIDKNTEIIYNIQGDILLNKVSYKNIILGLNDRCPYSPTDTMVKLNCLPKPKDNHLPSKDYYYAFPKP